MNTESTRPLAPRWCFVVLVLALLALYVPMLVMATGAFQTPEGWGVDAFTSVLSNPYWMDALWNSVLVAFVAAVGSTFLGCMAALAGAGLVLGPMLALAMVLPEIVFALILLTWFALLGFNLGLVTVTLAHITFSVSFSYLIIRTQFEKLDPLLFEAAANLGAGGMVRLISLTLPLLKPALLSSFFIAFLLSFDDFLISFFVNGVGSDTLPMKLYASMKMGMTSELNALATIMVLISAFCIFGLLIARLKVKQK